MKSFLKNCKEKGKIFCAPIFKFIMYFQLRRIFTEILSRF